jgi:predicted DNA-binding protein (UPF0251 family)
MNFCSLFLRANSVMSRTKKNRLIQNAPDFCGFRPFGIRSHRVNDVSITFEEYEALKLCDYEMLTQAEAAKMMNISRPTFTRIYESVRRKIATAFAEGSGIGFETGNVEIASWYQCNQCRIAFTPVSGEDKKCPFCKGEEVTEKAGL